MQNLTLNKGEVVYLQQGGHTFYHSQGTYEFDEISINSGSTVVVYSDPTGTFALSIYANNLFVSYGSVLNAYAQTQFTFTNNVTLDWKSYLSSDGTGYPAQQGPSPGLSTISTGGVAYGRYE